MVPGQAPQELGMSPKGNSEFPYPVSGHHQTPSPLGLSAASKPQRHPPELGSASPAPGHEPSLGSDLRAHGEPVRGALCGHRRRAVVPRPGLKPGEDGADGHALQPPAPPHRPHPEGEVVAPQAGAGRAVRVRARLPLHQPALLRRPCRRDTPSPACPQPNTTLLAPSSPPAALKRHKSASKTPSLLPTGSV